MNTRSTSARNSASQRLIPILSLLLCAPVSHAQIYVGSGLFTAKVAKYSTAGTVINSSLITGLSFPTGLALDGQGSLYVVDRNHNSVGKYTESGATINSSLLTYSTPSGIAYDGQGHLFVARTEPGSIGEFSTSGAPVSVPFATGLFNPDGVAFFDGKVYALDSSAIYIYNTAGTLLTTIAASTPWGICFDDSGHMFVPRQGFGAIAEYTTSGTLINNNLITGLSNPVYTGFDGQSLYVAELNNGNSRIGKYTTSGAPINPNLITGIDHFDSMVVAPEPSFIGFGVLSLLALGLGGRNRSR
jgi:sugar lactone lactonase YvrE